MPYIHDRFPHLEAALRELVQAHQELDANEPLHLAIAYEPARDQEDVFLFELVGNFGANLVDPDRRFLETTFAGERVFPEGGHVPDLRVLLTSPTELDVALREHWPAAVELRDAISKGRYDVLSQDPVGEGALGRLTHGEAAA
jgi:hypothetical protein